MMLRLWYKLGFGIRQPRVFTELKEGFAERDFIATHCFRIPWADRLRILLSGKAHLVIIYKMDVEPTKCEALATFSVLHPGAKIPTPAQ